LSKLEARLRVIVVGFDVVRRIICMDPAIGTGGKRAKSATALPVDSSEVSSESDLATGTAVEQLHSANRIHVCMKLTGLPSRMVSSRGCQTQNRLNLNKNVKKTCYRTTKSGIILVLQTTNLVATLDHRCHARALRRRR